MPKKKLILFGGIGLLVLLLAGGGFFAYKKFFAAPPAEAAEGGKDAKAEGGHGKEEKGKDAKAEGGHGAKEGGKEGGGEKVPGAANAFMGPTHTLTFVVNLADAGRPRFLKIHMDMELEDDKSLSELESIKPKARDSIITLLSSHTTDSLSSVADKQKLKDEVLHRLNSIMTSGRVKEVYFSEFMVQ